MKLIGASNDSVRPLIGKEFFMYGTGKGDVAFFLFKSPNSENLGFRTSKITGVKVKKNRIYFYTENSTYGFELDKEEFYDGKRVTTNEQRENIIPLAI